MKKSLAIMVVSASLLFGIGAAKANNIDTKANNIDTTLAFTDNGTSFNAIYGNTSIDPAFSDIFRFTFPTDAVDAGDASISISFDFNESEITFSSFVLQDLTDDVTIASGATSNILSNLKLDGADVTHSFALFVTGSPIGENGGYSGNISISPETEPIGENGSYSGNISISPEAETEIETYAMLLVGLGLIGFAARRRKHKFN